MERGDSLELVEWDHNPEDINARKDFIDGVALSIVELAVGVKDDYYHDVVKADAKLIGAEMYKTKEQMHS